MKIQTKMKKIVLELELILEDNEVPYIKADIGELVKTIRGFDWMKRLK